MLSLELVAVVLTLAAVYLTVRQIIWCWPLALISVALYARVFYDARLYADMGLQGLYFGLAVYGWWSWLHGGEDDGELEVSLTPPRTRAVALLVATLGGILLGQTLTRFTNAPCSHGLSRGSGQEVFEMRKLASILVLVLSTAVGAMAQSTDSEVKAIVGANVVDIDGGEPVRDAVVVIVGERSSAIGPASSTPVPTGAEVIHADGMWLVPGLMNMHVHFGLKLPGKMQAELANEKDTELALRVAYNARQSLLSGVTTIRSTGDTGAASIALDKAIKKGQAIGPRIFSPSDAVPISGGHGARHGETYDGPYELMKAVRERVSDGASWIKIAISGGIASQGGAIAEATMTPEEMEAVIDSAHRFGRKVTWSPVWPRTKRSASPGVTSPMC